MKLQGSKQHFALPGKTPPAAGVSNASEPRILREQLFHKLLRMEKKRAHRANRPIMLMVLDVDSIGDSDQQALALSALASVLPGALRLTDIKGWYEKDASLGILLTEMGNTDPRVVKGKVTRKIASALLRSGPVSWDGLIGATTSIFYNGGEPEVESGVLDLTSPPSAAVAQAGPAPPASSPRGAPAEQAPLFFLDVVCILVSLLLISWSRSWDTLQPAGRLGVELVYSALVLLSVTLLFGFYRADRLLLGRHGIPRVALATSLVALVSILCTLLFPHVFPHPDLFLRQTLIVWFIIFSWKAIYARHFVRTRMAKPSWVEHRNSL